MGERILEGNNFVEFIAKNDVYEIHQAYKIMKDYLDDPAKATDFVLLITEIRD